MEQILEPRSPKRSIRFRLIIGLCWIYIVGLIGFFVWRSLAATLPPFLTLISYFTPFLFVPSLLLFAVAMLFRSRAVLLGSLIAVALFLALYGPFFLPRLGPIEAHTDIQLTVMTFNLWVLNSHPQQSITAIEDQAADLVALQELTPSVAGLLRAELAERYPHTVLNASTGLLSRYPILEVEWFQPTDGGHATLHAIVDVDGIDLHVFALHPSPPGLRWFKNLPVGLDDGAQQRHVTAVVERMADLRAPVLLLGDLNMSDQTRTYARLSSLLKDAYREAGWGFGFTFPHGLRVGRFSLPGPLVRIDYIFHSDDFRADWARVNCSSGSDHCYLSARLTSVATKSRDKATFPRQVTRCD